MSHTTRSQHEHQDSSVCMTCATPSLTPTPLYAANTEQEFYPNAVPELANSQVLLRAYSESEIDSLLPLLQDRQAQRWSRAGSCSASEYRAELRAVVDAYAHPQPAPVHLEWAIYRATDLQPVGFIYLQWHKASIYEAEVGYLLASPYWNQGFATTALELVRDFAFLELGIGKLTALCAWNNSASLCVLSKTGFSHERSPRQAILRQGQLVDTTVMGLTRQEYASLQLAQQRYVRVSRTGLVTPDSPRAQRFVAYVNQMSVPAYHSARIKHLGIQVLETARLRLAPIGRQHASQAFHNWLNDPWVSRFMVYPTYTSVADVAAKFTSIAKSYLENPDSYFWGIFRKEDDALIGSISLRIESLSHLDIGVPGYGLGRKYWGQGYATEAMQEVLRFAFCEVGLPVLQICHVTANTASANVIRKSGFTFIGMQRAKPHVVDGKRDLMYYDLLAADYFARHPDFSRPQF